MQDDVSRFLLEKATDVVRHLDKQPLVWTIDDTRVDRWWELWDRLAKDWFGEVEKYSAFAKKMRIVRGESMATDMIECLLAYLKQDNYDCKTEEEAFVFRNLMNDEITLVKKDGTEINNIKANVQKGNIRPDFDRDDIVYDEGDTILRQVGKNHQEKYVITNATYNKSPHKSMIPDHWHLEVSKVGSIPMPVGAVYVGKTDSVVVNQTNDVKTGDVNNAIQSNE